MMEAQVVVGPEMAKDGLEVKTAKMLLIMLVTGEMTSQQQMTGIMRSIQVMDKSVCFYVDVFYLIHIKTL